MSSSLLRRFQIFQNIQCWWLVWPLAFLFFGIAFLGIFFDIPAICNDCISRLHFSYEWMKQPQWLQVTSWLPLHHALYGSIMKVGPSPFVTAHFLTAFFSSGLIWMGACLTRLFSNSNVAAILAALLIAFAPMRLWMGFSMLTEPAFCFLFFSFLLAVVQWRQQDETRYLWLACVLCALLTAYRYVAWPVAAAFALWIFAEKPSLERFIKSTLCVAFPLAWLVYIQSVYGNPFFAFAYHASDSRSYYGDQMPSGFLAVFSSFKYFLFPYLIFLLAPIMTKLSKQQKVALKLCVGLTLFEWYSIYNQVPTVFPARSIFLSGMTALCVSAWISQNLLTDRKKRVFVVAALVLHAIVSTHTFFKFQPQYDTKSAELAQRLHTLFQQDPSLRVGEDLDGLEYMIITHFSRRPQQFAPVRMSSEKGIQVLSKTEIPMFVLQSPAIAEEIHRRWQGSSKIPFHQFWIVSKRADLLQAFQDSSF